jgi:hypothetical protein
MPSRLLSGFRSIALALGLLLFSNCFSTATIQRHSGPPIEARIDRSDSEKLYLTSATGEHFTLDRSDIVDIDHPGNVRLTIGIAAAVLGTVMLVGANTSLFCSHGSSCVSPEGFLGLYLFGMGFALASLPLVGTGWWTYAHSVRAAEPALLPLDTQANIHDLPRLTCSFCPRHP